MVLDAAIVTQQGGPWMQWSDPKQAGWISTKLEEAKRIFDEIGSAAFMVIHHGAVVVAWGNFTFPYQCHSIRKSILSALYGFNVQDGIIDINRTLAELQIDDIPPLTETEKEAQIIHLLKARSGIYHEAVSETEAMKKNRPIRGSYPADTHWYYNNWDFNALGSIFEQVTKCNLYDEFERRIALPLCLEDYSRNLMRCYNDERYSIHGAHHYRLSTRDLARFGMLYLQKGKWGNKSLLSESWVEESTTPYSVGTNGNMGYGYMWWTVMKGMGNALGVYEAAGYGGHRVSIIPKADIVLIHRADTNHDLLNIDKHPHPELTPLPLQL